MAHAQQGLSLVSYGLIFQAASMNLMSMASTFDRLLSKEKSRPKPVPNVRPFYTDLHPENEESHYIFKCSDDTIDVLF